MSLLAVLFAAALLPFMALSISGFLLAAEWLQRRMSQPAALSRPFERMISA